MNISVAKVKEIREQIGATHLILFAFGSDGEQNVSTHGLTEQHANEAAAYGNQLKKLLGWPGELCQSQPEQRADWNRKTVSQIKAQIAALREEGEDYADRLDSTGWCPDNSADIESLHTSVAQVRYAIQQLEWVLEFQTNEAA